MRIDSIRELELGLNELEKYIDYNQACNKSISDAESIETPNPDSLTSLIGISNRFRRKKVFEYNAYIISLYGLFERFIENILQDYLNDICSTLIDYRKFPEQIKNNNLALNVDLLKNLSNPKYQNLNKENLIKTLNDGFNEHKAVLNVDAFKHHPYNFKQSIVSEYFGNIGITGLNNELKVYSPLKDLLNEKSDYP